MLAETKDGKRVYAEDPTVRKATLHTVGDTKGFISSGIQSVYKADLTGYNLLFGVYSIERYGKGNNMQLTIDSRVCAKAYSLLSDYKAAPWAWSITKPVTLCALCPPPLMTWRTSRRT